MPGSGKGACFKRVLFFVSGAGIKTQGTGKWLVKPWMGGKITKTRPRKPRARTQFGNSELMRFRKFLPFSAIFLFVFSAFGFLPPRDTAGPLTLLIANPSEVMALGRPLRINVTVTNTGSTELYGVVRLGVIDDWCIENALPKTFSVAAKSAQSLSFNVIPGRGSYAALYPVHAFAQFRDGSAQMTAHAILIVSVSPAAVAVSPAPDHLPALKLPTNGRLRLDVPNIFQPFIAVRGVNPAAKPVGWQGVDETTGALVQLMDIDRGNQRHALAVHPAWRKGWGDVFTDYRVALPNQAPIALDFATAIRDNTVQEPPSDGVEYRVLVKDGGAFKTLFTRFSAAKRWEPAHVDLSAYASHEITLRLVTDPGPAHDTTCDQSYWAEPILTAGAPQKPETDAERLARRQKALELAKEALHGGSFAWSWKIESEAGRTGAAIVPGPSGLADSFIAFVDDRAGLVFDGFTVQVDGQDIGAGSTNLPCERVEQQFDSGRGTIKSYVALGENSLAVQAAVWAEKGALRIAFSMPGARRDLRGEPRFSTLGIGPASDLARRVYAGFGNVIQDPARFDLQAGGFTLSTRHVGMDFTNGLSLVQASDIFPDRFHVDPEQRAYSLIAHHDATFSFIPSTHQAFAAARVYRALADFKPAGGVASLLGRICLDQWGGDYRTDARDIELAARYGVTDAVYVQHVWQRWGYDYRLPDIYPPAGSMDDFLALVAACKRHGILFCPHDNYIDFYPDATGFSYDHILFNADGTPQKAWFNKGREAQSYRWSPIAFGPWLEANLKQVKAGFAPAAYFVDVFSAMPPIDFYDRLGRFYPKTVTAARWGAAFDRIREILGNHAPTISEAGQDGLIGHLDAGESDHAGWLPDRKAPDAFFRWRMQAGDGERIPWHDMASHGSFVLLGGGLGPRYAGGQDEILHGYASDDYLSLTVLGGRNPMCEGPFSRRAVMTYWLLHDVCNSLAHDQMLTDEFAGDDIHRQIARFSNGGMAQVNRGKGDWTTEGQALPSFGFIAKAGRNEADITRRGGIISAYAKSPGVLFVDARPANASEGEGQVLATVTGVDDLGNRRFRLRIDWQVMQPVAAGFKPFVHFVDEKRSEGEGIVFQGALDLDSARLGAAGTLSSTAEVTVPANISAPVEFAIRFGLYNPGVGGRRLRMLGAADPGERALGGTIQVEPAAIRWQPEPPDPAAAERAERLNMANKLVDFGPAATNGAFRLTYGGASWQLTPLPGSSAFQVNLHLDQLAASARKIQSITSVGADGNPAGPVKFQQDGQTVQFDTAARVFAYRLSFAN